MSATSTKRKRAERVTAKNNKPDRPHRVLLVDDDPGLRKAMALRLEMHGLEIQTAACGSDAISAFEKQHADMVVLDVNMPDIDGFEVCQKIKAIRDVPVIFVTGEQNPIINAHMPQIVKTVGGLFYLGKPCDAQLLLKLITDILDKPSA